MIIVKVKELMEKQGIKTHQELAKAIDIHRHTVENLVNRETHGIDFRVLDQLCDFFKVGPGEILDYKPIKDPRDERKTKN